MGRLPAFVIVTALAAGGCERAAAQSGPGPRTSGERVPVLAASAVRAPQQAVRAQPAGAPAGEATWVEALRVGRYAEAARSIDALGNLAARPELRFARARAAAELGESSRVLELLDGLEHKLPLLDARIRRLRADAQLAVGPYASAADFFVRRGDPDSLARAALAREREGQLAQASALAGQVVAALKGKRRRSVEAMARDVRARASEKSGSKSQAITDLRWLALEDPVGSPGADVRLEALAPERRLTKEERLGRALALGRAGALERVLVELQAIAKAPGAALAPARLDRARAFALYYARRDYREASELFARAARGPGTDPAESLFYAARAHSRAQDDEQAVRGYRELERRFPRSSHAEQASYLVARVHYAGGRFAEAAAAYDAYLARFGARARSHGDAVYERGVAWLALGRYPQAATTFASLARAEKDSRRAARLRHLEGVARAGAGEPARAEALFRQVAKDQPLGFVALASRERLKKLGGAPPPAFPASAAVPVLPALKPALPSSVVTLHGLGLAREAELELLSSESSFSARYGARKGEALCAAYGELGVAARRYQVAQDFVEAEVLRVVPLDATRWQWDCVYPEPYPSAVRNIARETGVPPELLYGVMRQESAFRPEAQSEAGARGLMQLMPATAERLSVELGEPFDAARLTEPHTNLRLGARYLRKLLDAFGGNVALTAAAYNAGPIAVRRWMENAGALPLDVFVSRIPYGETLEYVERVVGNFARYRYLDAGDGGVPELALELPVPPPSDGLY